MDFLKWIRFKTVRFFVVYLSSEDQNHCLDGFLWLLLLLSLNMTFRGVIFVLCISFIKTVFD